MTATPMMLLIWDAMNTIQTLSNLNILEKKFGVGWPALQKPAILFFDRFSTGISCHIFVGKVAIANSIARILQAIVI